ncbi:MAG: SAV_915 family protein [Actinomadura sp.]
MADDPAAPTVVGRKQAQAAEIAALSGEDVFVPSGRFAPGADAAVPEVRRLDDGRVALLVYSSLELLVSGCGQAQPWIRIRLAGPKALDELARLAGVDLVLWDVEVPEGVRHMSRSGRDAKRRGEDE